MNNDSRYYEHSQNNYFINNIKASIDSNTDSSPKKKGGRVVFVEDDIKFKNGSTSPKTDSSNLERFNKIYYEEDGEMNKELAEIKILDYIQRNKILAKNTSKVYILIS